MGEAGIDMVSDIRRCFAAPKGIKPAGNRQLFVQRKRHPGRLLAITQGRVVDRYKGVSKRCHGNSNANLVPMSYNINSMG